MATDVVFAMRANWTRRWQVLLDVERSIREQPASHKDHSSNIEWLPGADVRVPAEVLKDFRYYVTDQLEESLAWLADSLTEASDRSELRGQRDACLWLLNILDEHEGTNSVVKGGYVEVAKAG